VGSAKPTWNDEIFFSVDQTLGSDTVLSVIGHTTTLAPGGSYSPTQMVTLPNVPPGTYYLFLRVDALNQLAEGDESNNTTMALPIVVQTPDLIPTAFSAPATGAAGHQVSASFTVKNQGSANARPNWNDQIYFSTDMSFGNDTALAVSARTTPLAPGDVYTVVQNVTLPKMPPATYYLLMRTDTLGQVYEGGADANNDASPVPITITTPDLVPTDLTAPQSATHGTQISVSFTVANQGAATADPNWNDQVSLSTDPLVGNDTVLLITARTIGLAAGATYTTSQTVTLPNVTPGTYYLLLQADVVNGVYEGGADANNLKAVQITIQ
jgi:subtilase family serine protease